MKIPSLLESVSDYVRAEKYALASIRKPSDLHLAWGPIYSRMGLGIGARLFSLYSLAEVPRSTWGEYLVNEPLKARYAAITPKEARVIADDKIRFFEHCSQHGIATAKIVALVKRSRDETTAVRQVCSAPELAEVLVPGSYFVKPASGSHGEGAFSLAVHASGLEWSGRKGSYEDFFRHCDKALEHTRSLIVQPKLFNHRAIRELTQAKGLSTVRVVTFRKADGIKVVAACLRIVVGESEVDNFSAGAGGNLTGAVDVATGRLITARGSRSRHWPTITDVLTHPRSGATIVGMELPHWPALLELVQAAHASIPSLHTVGWDVAITDAGPVIVEANWRYDIDLLQVAYKKGFARIISEHLPR